MKSCPPAGPGTRASVLSVSGTEEHEPEHAQDQDREAGGGYEHGEHRGARLGLPRLGRGFDGLTLRSRCHAGLDLLDVARMLDARCQGNACFQMMFRVLLRSDTASHEEESGCPRGQFRPSCCPCPEAGPTPRAAVNGVGGFLLQLA